MLWHNRPTIDDWKLFKADTVMPSQQPFKFAETKINQLPPINDWVENTFLQEYYSLEEFLIKSKTTAFLVIRNDSILYQNYFNGYFENQPSIVFSISKAITTALVGIAIRDGHIKDVDQKVVEYFGPFAKDQRREITLEHLLQMTSGLNHEDQERVLRLGMAYYNGDVKKYIANRVKLRHEPGTRFAYKSMDTQVLGICLEKAIDTTVAAYMQQSLWEPLGMEFPALITHDKKKNPRVYGGMAVCARDLAKIGRLFLNNGNWNGEQIIPLEWVTKSTTVSEDGGGWWGYSTGWWFNDQYVVDNIYDTQQFYATGFEGQYIFVDPQTDVIIVRQGYGKEDVKWMTMMMRLSRLINTCETTCELPLHATIDSLAFIGDYINKDGQRFNIRKDKEGEWILKGGAFSTFKGEKLDRESPRSLVNLKKKIRLIFHLDREGKVDGLYYDNFRRQQYYQKTAPKKEKKFLERMKFWKKDETNQTPY